MLPPRTQAPTTDRASWGRPSLFDLLDATAELGAWLRRNDGRPTSPLPDQPDAASNCGNLQSKNVDIAEIRREEGEPNGTAA